MQLNKAKRMTLTEQIVTQMEACIESGQWKLGAKIPAEPELVTQLGVSRNTVREAVKALIHAGMLEARQGDGTYVSSASGLGPVMRRRLQKCDEVEILEVRFALEREAVRLAAERCTAEDADYLRQCLVQLRQSQGTVSFVDIDLQIHVAIVHATHNAILMELYEQIVDAVRATIRPSPETQCRHDVIHTSLVEAIIRHDAEAGLEAMQQLIQLVYEGLEK